MSEPAVRYCPYCAAPLGSFFGVRADDGACWCERCGEFFRVRSVNEDEGDDREDAERRTGGGPD